jgi:hypothetical protein
MLTRNLLSSIKLSKTNFLKFSLFSHNTTNQNNLTNPSFPQYSLLKKTEFKQNLSDEEKKSMKKFVIHRYDPDQPENSTRQYMAYYIDLKECGPMILDALIKIKDEVDPTLSFRR